MKARSFKYSLIAAALALTACSFEPAATMNGVLVDMAGRTVYVFDVDEAGKSNCNGVCAAVWPPLTAPARSHAMGKFGVVEREDGSRQWTFEGRPLYHYAVDKRPGESKGDNAGGVWHTVQAATAITPGRLVRDRGDIVGDSYTD